MGWFRRNRVFGAQAALFALVVQFALAFGHVHALDGNHHGPAAAAAAIDRQDSPAPSDHPDQPDDALCGICATIHLTGSAQVAAAPALPAPVTYGSTELPLSSDTASDNPRRFELRSRGPPQA